MNLLHSTQGVPLFFILSGYLLSWTEGNRAKRGYYSLRAYALRRVLRLVPAYYVAILVAILVALLLQPRTPSLWDVISHLTFTHGLTGYYTHTINGAFWSLTPEVIFYLMLPVIILKLPRLWHRVALLVGLYLVALPTAIVATQYAGERYNTTYEINPFVFYASFPTNMLFLFVVGVLLHMLVEHLNNRPRSHLQPYMALALFLGSTAYLVSVSDEIQGEDLSFGLVMTSVLALIAFFASAVLGAPILRGLLKWRLLSFSGLISYSMFLFHSPVLMLISGLILVNPEVRDWVTQNGVTMWVSFSVYLLVVCVVVGIISYLGYRYIESPFLRYKPK